LENNIHKSTKDTEQYRTSLTIGMNIKDRLQMLADADDRSLASYIRKVLAEHTEKANIILTPSNNEPEVSKEVSKETNKEISDNNIKNKLATKEELAIVKIDIPQNNNQNTPNNDGGLSFTLPTVKIKNNPF